MNNRDLGVVEIFERIQSKRIELGLVSFKRTPTRPSNLDDLPCVFMTEGIDQIIKKSTRDTLGYPAIRSLEISLELVVNRKKVNIKTIMSGLRQSVFTVRDSDPVQFSSVIADNVFIQENRMEGPLGYGLPDIEVMRLIVDLTYIDGGL